MKKIVIVLLAAVLTVSVASAYLGEIVASFPTPVSYPRGIGVGTGELYVLIYTTINHVYRVNWDNGAVIGSFRTPLMTNNHGICYSSGGHVWVGNYGNNFVYDCNSVTGSVYRSWNARSEPYGLAPFCTGDGGAGTTAIFSRDYAYPNNLIRRHHMGTGSIYASFPFAHRALRDIAYDFRNKLFWAEWSTDVYGYNATTGSVVASFSRPYAGYGVGAAYSNSYLWIATMNRYIYKLKCPGNVGISPASMGKIKAIYK